MEWIFFCKVLSRNSYNPSEIVLAEKGERDRAEMDPRSAQHVTAVASLGFSNNGSVPSDVAVQHRAGGRQVDTIDWCILQT